MVDLACLHPGDIVKIVDSWDIAAKAEGGMHREALEGEMDRFLGTFMTVARVAYGDILVNNSNVVVTKPIYAEMREDEELTGISWCWYSGMIEYVVSNMVEPSDISPSDSIAEFFDKAVL